jgi:hypothetical protein
MKSQTLGAIALAIVAGVAVGAGSDQPPSVSLGR